MIDIRIICDKCGNINLGYSSRLAAINDWSQGGGWVSPFSGEAICGICMSKENHPTNQKWNKSQ
jgi:hypothetical protein